MNEVFQSLLNAVVVAASGQPPLVQGFLFCLFVYFVALVFLVIAIAFRTVAGARTE